MAFLELRGLNKIYGKNHVLQDINISIPEGKLISFLGPSGCGKSTLLRCIAGLETVSNGKIYLDNKDLTDVPIQKRDVGMVFQNYSLFPNLTVFDNIAFGLKIRKETKEVIARDVNEMLDLVGLTHKKDRFPAFLSGGEQQRVALARALIMKPKVLLLDEPLSALDAQLRKNLQNEIRRIQRQLRITTLFVTHDQSEAMAISDIIYLFNIGKIESSGSPIEIYMSPKTEFAARFIGNYNLLTSEIFSELTGCRLEAAYLAFRPEVVKLSEPEFGDDSYFFSAAVKEVNIHGNFIRYVLLAGKAEFAMDILSDLGDPLLIGETRQFAIRKDCVLTIHES